MKRKGLLIAAVVALLTVALGWMAVRKGNSLRGRSTRGEQLAHAYCQSCHLFPEPAVLDKASWTNGALPEMARWLGLEPGELERLPNGEIVSDSDVFPHTPLIRGEDWNAIVRYYSQAAPTLAEFKGQSSKFKVAAETKQFRIKALAYSRQTPMTLMTRIDPAREVINNQKSVIRGGRLYVGDAMTHTLEALDPAGQRIFAVEFDSGPVSIVSRAELGMQNAEWLDVLLVGRAFPSDLMKGKLLRIRGVQTSEVGGLQMDKLIGNLRRPVHSIAADLNGDGREDFVVCQFGNRKGQLSWFEALPEGRFEEHVLMDRPGAIRAEVRDMNHDGRPDIIALMGQAREGVYLFINEGSSGSQVISNQKSVIRFSPVTLVEQHPAFGYSYFELVDFDNDGDLDLLTVNGDNGESFAPPKPYHGIRIYLNDGQNHFAERWFFPLDGAYAARAIDFDLDGDLDIAAISYFPDYLTPGEASFVYLENRGNFDFKASTIPEHVDGRWITMDAGDLDGDGDADIVLGSLVLGPPGISIPPTIRERWKSNAPAVLFLENTAK